MKIAVLTQALLNNYGGLLQNYALQKVLKKMGHDVITIDFKQKNHYKPLLSVLFCRISAKILKLFGINNRKSCSIPRFQNRRPVMDMFVKEHISVTRSVSKYSIQILKKYGIEACVVGSDQVWRPIYNHFLEDMYLKFAKDFPVKKIAYAASFGVDEWEYSETQTQECRILAKSFNAISVRESSGVDLCFKNFNVQATLVLDPTLLLEKSEYLDLCSGVARNTERYLAVYVLDLDETTRHLCESVAKDRNLTLKIFSANIHATLTIPEWLAMFRDSSYVVTDSFHGTVFSIIFEKEFKCIYNENRGSARFETLLNLYNFGKIEDMRQFSLNWLKKTLES